MLLLEKPTGPINTLFAGRQESADVFPVSFPSGELSGSGNDLVKL